MTTFRGGARVGLVNSTVPFGRLAVGSHELVLATGFSTIHFSRDDVVAIQALAGGIQIVHTRSDVAERVIFWYGSGPKRILEAVESVGFVPAGDPNEPTTGRGMAFRVPFLVTIALLWNAILLPSFFATAGETGRAPFGWPMVVAPALVAVVALLILLPTPMRKLALTSEDRSAEVRPLLILILGVCAVIAVGMGVAVGAR